jgi:AcrR family transcriptional regulator
MSANVSSTPRALQPREARAATREVLEPGSRLGLSRKLILDTALKLLDRDGLDALTMRRLAEELEVGTMTLYGYFRRKDELLDALVDAVAGRIAVEPGQGFWKARLRELMIGVRKSHAEHPAIVELRLRRPLVSAGALRVTEQAMTILCDAGFSRREAARAYRTLLLYTFGFSAFGPSDHGQRDSQQTVEALAALPRDRFPVLSESVVEAAEAMADQSVFELGLDCLIDGLEQRLTAGARGHGAP